MSAPLRVALLHHSLTRPRGAGAEAMVRELARALLAAGHEPALMGSRPGPTRRSVDHGVPMTQIGRLPELPLRRRGFDSPLTHIPATARELRRGGYQLVHAFTPQDAAAARRTALPVVFTWPGALGREDVASQRLRLSLLTRALEESDAVTAPDEAARAALRRWMAIDAPVIAPGDAAGHERLYRDLLAQPGWGARRAPRR